MKITLKEYAARNFRAHSSARHMAQRGSFKTAEKLGRDWFIDEDEPYPDHRRREQKNETNDE